jgi:multimeric flavodoxin WrbA
MRNETDRTTAACAAAAIDGIGGAGGTADEIRLNDLKVGMCRACDNGLGPCRSEHECQVEDDFQALHARVLQADACVLVTPLSWQELRVEASLQGATLVRGCVHRQGYGLSGYPYV